jgi:hypothetical protein
LFSVFASLAYAQEKAKGGVSIQTENKMLTAKLMLDKVNFIEVTGKAVFRLTSGNSDDSLTGIFTYTLLAEDRHRVAQAINKRADEVPSVVVQDEVAAQFAKNTECPTIALDLLAMDLAFSEKALHFNRFVLEFKFAPGTAEPKDKQEHAARVICTLARRIKTGFTLGRSPLRRLNELLNGEDPQ